MVYLAFIICTFLLAGSPLISSRVIMQECTMQNSRKSNCILFDCNTRFFTLLKICEIVNPTL